MNNINNSYPSLDFCQQNTRQEGVVNLKFPELFSSHFTWSIVGSPGCGKTTWIQNLLQQPDFYKGKFDYIFVISPSTISIVGVDSECIAKEFKIEWIYERLNYLQQLNIKNANLLIIMDDCVSAIKQFQNNPMLINLFFNRRHLWKDNTISIILTTQQFTMLPLKFRSVCDHFTFLSMSPRDFDFCKKELIYSSSRKCMDQVIETFQGPRYQFIYIRLQPFLLCQNFKPLIRGSQYISMSNDFSNTNGNVIQKTQQKFLPPKQQDNCDTILTNNENIQQLFSFKKK